MSTFNFLVYLNAYSDRKSTNSPSRGNFKWTRDTNGLPVSDPTSLDFDLAPGETKTLVNGTRTLTQDNTTQYSIALAPFQTTLYNLSWVGGTNPTFRTSRTSGADATTQVTVTVNGTVVTFASTGGTPFNLISGGVIVGDYVTIGNTFNSLNQGQWQIISLTATSFSVVNPSGVNEGPYILGSGFANQINIYSAAGVQVGDTLQISGGFSPVTQGYYTVTAVTNNYLQFSSVGVLPAEGPITTESIAVFSNAQRFIYLESNQHVTIVVNNISGNEINPLVGSVSNTTPGIFLRTSTVYSLTVTNVSTGTAKLFFAAVE